jgi:hypothetical protein
MLVFKQLFTFLNHADPLNYGESCGIFTVSICNICVKQKISSINKIKPDKILLKLKVLAQEKLHVIL